MLMFSIFEVSNGLGWWSRLDSEFHCPLSQTYSLPTYYNVWPYVVLEKLNTGDVLKAIASLFLASGRVFYSTSFVANSTLIFSWHITSRIILTIKGTEKLLLSATPGQIGRADRSGRNTMWAPPSGLYLLPSRDNSLRTANC
jgi:hypothetical protein